MMKGKYFLLLILMLVTSVSYAGVDSGTGAPESIGFGAQFVQWLSSLWPV